MRELPMMCSVIQNDYSLAMKRGRQELFDYIEVIILKYMKCYYLIIPLVRGIFYTYYLLS